MSLVPGTSVFTPALAALVVFSRCRLSLADRGNRREGKAGGQLVSHFGARSHCLPSVWQGEVGRYGEVGGTSGFLLSVCSSLPFPHLPSSSTSPEFFSRSPHSLFSTSPHINSSSCIPHPIEQLARLHCRDISARFARLAPGPIRHVRDPRPIFFFSAPDPSPSYPRCGSSSSPWAHFPSSIIHFPLSSLHHPGV